MTVVEWDEVPNQFLSPKDAGFQQKYLANKRNANDTHKAEGPYVQMQKVFLRGCTRHLQAHNRTWTLIVDTDEYISMKDSSRHAGDLEEVMSEPGAVMKVMQAERADNSSTWYQRDCFPMERLDMSAIESPAAEREYRVPPYLDACRFQTARFRHAANGVVGKPIVDISKMDAAHVDSTHGWSRKPFYDCGNQWGNKMDPMHVLHYLGGWELYGSRASDRRGYDKRRAQWIKRANRTSTHNMLNGKKGQFFGDRLRPWLQGFVNYVGKDRAISLLADSGFTCNAETVLQELSYPNKNQK